MGLERYKQKRDFKRTNEPAGKPMAVPPPKRARMFVIQKHDASRLHYDFRLEMEGVLKSWAVPKGIPTVKGEKRLALHVEDHPLEYGDFEGIIPEGNYGAGSVMIWDTGTWEPLDGDGLEGLRKGKLRLRLAGRKLKGEWTLVRMHGTDDQKEAWLLIKSGDTVQALSARADDQSVLSGRSMKEIAMAQDRSWKSNRSSATGQKKRSPRPDQGQSEDQGASRGGASAHRRSERSPSGTCQLPG